MERLSLYIVVFGIASGVLLSSRITLSFWLVVFLVLIGITIPIVSQILGYPILSFKKITRTTLVWLFMIFFLFGLIRVALWQQKYVDEILPSFVSQKIEVSGVVVDTKESEQSQSFVIEVISIKQNNVTELIDKEKMLITTSRHQSFYHGDEVIVSGKVSVPGIITDDNGETFDYGLYLSRQGIFTTMYFPNITVVGKNVGIKSFLYSAKHWFIKESTETLSYPHSGLFTGLVISGRSGLTDLQQEIFNRSGLAHIVALSGTNVTIIVHALMLSLFFVRKKWRLFLGIFGIVAFIIITGAEPTVLRAGLMGIMSLTAVILVRTYDIGRSLFLVAGVMILYDPMLVFNLSFQLSFIATFAMIFASPLVMIKYESIINIITEKYLIREIVVTSIVIEIFLLPIFLYAMGEFSVIAVLSNVLVLPILPIAMASGFFAVLVGVINYYLALPLIWFSYIFLQYIFSVAEIVSSFPFATLKLSLPLWLMFVCYVIILFWFIKMKKEVDQKDIKVSSSIERFNFLEKT